MQGSGRSVTLWTVPLKRSPPNCPRQNNRSPPDQISQPYLVPPCCQQSPAADCSLFAIAFATMLAYGEQAGHCLFNQNKVRQHLLKSLQEGKMTPLPLKKDQRNGCQLNTWNTVYLYIGCYMVWE